MNDFLLKSPDRQQQEIRINISFGFSALNFFLINFEKQLSILSTNKIFDRIWHTGS